MCKLGVKEHVWAFERGNYVNAREGRIRRESKKSAIAEILQLNNMRIEQQLAFIIHLVIDERERNISNNTYLN